MSAEERIDHVAEARRFLGLVPASMHSDEVFAVAQVHATLALVEQQRIANMIALSRPEVIDEGHDTKVWVSSWEVEHNDEGLITSVRLRTEIADALGIGGDDA